MILGLLIMFCLIWYFFVYRIMKPYYEKRQKKKFSFWDSFNPDKWK